MNVDVHVDQQSVLSRSGLAESDVRDITVALPQGVVDQPRWRRRPGSVLERSGRSGAEPGNQIGFEGFAESKLEPGVSNPVFTPYAAGQHRGARGW